MRPLSMDIPKPLLPIAGRPIIYHGIQALSKCEGLKEVLLIGFCELRRVLEVRLGLTTW
jgi:mannose-1-phosphate guanylyltransferase